MANIEQANILNRTSITTYTHDALNRLTSINFPLSGEDISYAYDTCANGIGRLCSVTDPSGSRTFAYDGFGRLASTTLTANGQTYTTGYSWTVGDRLASITYPSGRLVSYTRNALGQITGITTGGQTIVSSRTYRADGLLTGQTYGNGLIDVRGYDLRGLLTSWSTGSIDSRSYGYDLNGNVTSINGAGYGYDVLDRVTSAPGAAWSWDGNGNRTADSTGSYSYASLSNRLTGTPAGAVSLDAAGNTTSIGSRSFEYNQAGRLATAKLSGVIAGQYLYSFDGHRAAKTVQGVTTLFHYAADGNLLAETSAGTTLKEYVWDDDGRPLAQIANGGITFLHPDHLGTPRFGTNSSQSIVWQWNERPFGTGPPTGSTVVNLRYPGHYEETETGLFQNWNRSYDKLSGRYLESDSVGLYGGTWSTYAYGNGNPLRYVDSMGLDWKDSAGNAWQSYLLWRQHNLNTFDAALHGNHEAAMQFGMGLVTRGVGGQIARTTGQCIAKELPDAALVCRGGACKADSFVSGSGVTKAADGTLNGVSTQSRAGASIEELTKPFKNNQVGVTTAGDIRAAGGRVTADGHLGNPNHATVDGLNPTKLEELFSPTISNPVPPGQRGF